jgi:hypothetical protein
MVLDIEKAVRLIKAELDSCIIRKEVMNENNFLLFIQLSLT